MSQVVGLPNNSYKPITNTAWVRAVFVSYQKRCTRLAAASDKVYQLLAHDRWFSPGTPASSTTKTGRHDIAKILLKVVLNTQQNQIKSFFQKSWYRQEQNNNFRSMGKSLDVLLPNTSMGKSLDVLLPDTSMGKSLDVFLLVVVVSTCPFNLLTSELLHP